MVDMDLTPGRWTPELVVLPFHLNFKKKNKLISFWLCWIFAVAQAFSLVVISGGYSLVLASGLHIVMASLVADHGL